LGPRRLWIAPIIFLSATVKNATASNNGTVILRIFNKIIRIDIDKFQG
jgi:hypothetical protein